MPLLRHPGDPDFAVGLDSLAPCHRTLNPIALRRWAASEGVYWTEPPRIPAQLDIDGVNGVHLFCEQSSRQEGRF